MVLADALYRLEKIGVQRQLESQTQLNSLEEGTRDAVLAPNLFRVRFVEAVSGIEVEIRFLKFKPNPHQYTSSSNPTEPTLLKVYSRIS